MAPLREALSGSGNRRLRSVVIGFGVGLLLVVYTQVLLPGAGSGGARGTPAAILFSGLVLGFVNALTATGLILVYRTTRIVNFAQTAIGAAGAELTFQLVQLTSIPFLLAFPAGLLLAGILGLAFDAIFVRRFFNAPRLVLTVATIAVAGLSVITTEAIGNLPFFGDQTLEQSVGVEELRRLLPFAGFDFQVGDLELPFGFPEVFAIEVSILALLLVAAFFRFTRAGVAVRAVAENNERASLLGISVGALSSIVWALAGVLGGASVILTGMLTVPGAATGVAPGVLLPALAAAVLARFRSLPVAALSAIAIAEVANATTFSFPDHGALVPFAMFLVIAGGLLMQRDRGGRSEGGEAVSWQATDEQRPVPKELAGVPTVRITRWVFIGLGLLVVLLYPFVVGTGAILLGGVVALVTILALSVVVLTGWAGQVSLGQYAFAAIGAVAGGALTGRVGLSFWLAVPLAAVLSGAFAVLIGIPALRIKGLFLAVTTLAFAFALQGVLFNEKYFDWLLPETIERPTLFFLDFSEQRSMYYLCVVALVVSIVIVTNLRKSRLGRTLIAARENDANVQAFGVRLMRTKLIAFAVSGGLAGMAGAILVHQQEGLAADTFQATASIDLFLLTVLGGVSSVSGALLGSAFWNTIAYFFPTNAIVQFFRPIAVLLILFMLPGGLISLVTRLRDEVLRIIAQRRQIMVPSLFADYDPEALERRVIPLGEASANAGMAALGAERFALASELYQGTGERVVEKLAPAKQTKEAAAIDAAANVAEAARPAATPPAGVPG